MVLVPKYTRNPMTTRKWSYRSELHSSEDIQRAKERANKPVSSWMGAMAKGVAVKMLEQAGIEPDDDGKY